VDFNQNYFELIGLPVSFDIDAELLNAQYLNLQKEVHPDRFASSSEHEKRLSMQWATLINTAHATLKDPLQRAIYLLEMKDVELAHNPVLPPAFLMEQIELREALEQIEESASLDALDKFRKQAEEVKKKVEREFADAIESDIRQAETAVYELQFITKLLVSADHLEEKLLEY
jgi:molecular chaperone HscB